MKGASPPAQDGIPTPSALTLVCPVTIRVVQAVLVDKVSLTL